MASSEVDVENNNASGSDEITDLDSSTTVNSLVLLVRIDHVDGRPIESEILMETSFRDLRAHTNPVHVPNAVEILSPYELRLTHEKGTILGRVAGELMAIEPWMDFPILIMVVIITRSKVDDIVEARQKHRWIQKEQEQKEIDKLRQGKYDLEEEFKEVVTQRKEFAKQLNDNVEKQTNLLKVVEQLTEKVSKLETQPFQTQGFMTSSSQNISNPFGNLSTSFQVKADIDIGKFSGTEPTPSYKLNYDQWCINVKSYQSSYPDNILLPAVQKSIVGKAKSIIRHLGPTYTVEEVISVLNQEYEGVASSDVIFKEFYQLRQERNEKVQVFSIQLRDALTRLSLRFPGRAPKEDQDKTLKDRFFHGIHPDLQNSIRHLYDDEALTFSQLLIKAHQNKEEEMTSKLVNKGSVMGNTLKERVD